MLLLTSELSLCSRAIIDNGPAARTFAAFIQTHHGTIQRDFINLVSAVLNHQQTVAGEARAETED